VPVGPDRVSETVSFDSTAASSVIATLKVFWSSLAAKLSVPGGQPCSRCRPLQYRSPSRNSQLQEH
jgi:hypothetical protein